MSYDYINILGKGYLFIFNLIFLHLMILVILIIFS
jgi:hypothetical protein